MGITKKRFYYLDLLRIIACFLVIMNHTQGYINCFSYVEGSSFASVAFKLTVGMLIKMNVPIFFMISGTLLLNKDYELRDLLKKAIRFFLILLGFSLVANFSYKGHLYIPGFIRQFITAKVDGAGPYWYLYAYIGLLLILVFLRYITKELSYKETVYLLLLRLVITGILPMMFVFMNRYSASGFYVAAEFNPAIILSDCIFYPIIGYGLDRCLDIASIKRRGFIALLAAFTGTVVIEAFLTWYEGPGANFSGLDFVMTCSFFLIIKYVLTLRPLSERAGRTVSAIGKLTFGIYLLDPIVGNVLKPLVHGLCPKVIPSLLLTSVLYCFLSMVVCGLLTWLWYFLLRRVWHR